MQPPAIGNLNFITMQGHAGLIMVDSVSEISRPGVDGVAFQSISEKSAPCEVITEVDAVDPVAFEQSCHDMEKTFQTVLTPLNKTINNVYVHRVEVDGHALIASAGGINGGANGNQATCLMTCRWRLQATETF